MAEIPIAPHSPLAGLAGAAAIQLREAPFVGKLLIRGDGGDAFCAAVGKVISAKPPLRPNTVTAASEATAGGAASEAAAGGATAASEAAAEETLILWLGPDEWQIQCPPQRTPDIAAKLRAAWGGIDAAAVEVSDYYMQMEIGGANARAVLESGCPLDLHPRAFADGACAQTRYHNAAILLRQTADGYNIQVRRSFAVYVWKHLREAARGF